MKIKFKYCLLIILLLLGLLSFDSIKKENSCFELYVVYPSDKFDEKHLDNIQIKHEPLFTIEDMEYYDWKNDEIKFKDSNWERIYKTLEIMGDEHKYNVLKDGIPFMILNNKKLIYDGVFWLIYSNFIYPKEPIIILPFFIPNMDSKRNPIIEKKFIIGSYIDSIKSIIKDKRIYECLKSAGKLKE
ncbi:MAG: hypothetical protein NT007_10685 [Candidatus Kapabacteria bacterium]|nr:hypothetical protein [Candidatus Kapabacteria bacterium]